MNELEQLEQRIEALSRADLAAFREWFNEYDQRIWDKQIEEDSKSGKLESFLAEAKEEYKQGKIREL